MQSSKLVSVSKLNVFFRKLPNDFRWICVLLYAVAKRPFCATWYSKRFEGFLIPQSLLVFEIRARSCEYFNNKTHCLRSISSVSKIHLGTIPPSEFHETLFSRRFSSKKSPTITVTFFSFFFVRPQTSSCMYHFLQTSLIHMYSSVQSLLYTVNPAITGSSPCFSQKLFRAILFDIVRLNLFRHSVTFFDFFSRSKGPTFKFFFDILQQTQVPKSPKGLPFHVFRHCETVQNTHFSFCFENLKKINFFVFKEPPFNLFDILQQTGCSKSWKGPLIQV